MDFNAGGTSYDATIPGNAQDEYQYPSAETYWTSKGWNNNDPYTVTNAGFHGFLFCGGSVDNAGGGSTMVGALFVLGDVTTNTMVLYYDADVGSWSSNSASGLSKSLGSLGSTVSAASTAPGSSSGGGGGGSSGGGGGGGGGGGW